MKRLKLDFTNFTLIFPMIETNIFNIDFSRANDVH